MRKLISVLVLFGFFSVAAYAELKASFNLDITQNLLSATTPLDDDADTEGNPSNRFPGKFDFFTENRNEQRQSEMYLRLDYLAEGFDARVEFNGNTLVNRRDRGIREGFSFVSLLDAFPVGDFWVRGNLGNINALYGRIHTRGTTNDYRFDTNTWWDRRYTGANPPNGDTLGPYRFFGFQMPKFRYTEVNNHRVMHGGEHYMLVGAKMNNFGLELSGSRLVNKAVDQGSAISFAARISGVEVADLINFDVIYGVTGEDATMNEFGDNNTNSHVGKYADGLGHWDHRFGLYGGLNLLDGNLGLGFGYSGSFLFYEKWEEKGGSPSGSDLQRLGPYYNGIDLKAQFKGIDRLTFTTAINASFSTVKGTKNDENTRYMGLGILSGGLLSEKQEEAFFGLAAGLTVGYDLGNNLDVAAQIKNSAQWEDYKDDNKELNTVRNQLGVALTVRYQITQNFTIMSGLAMQMDHITNDGKNPEITYKGGDLYFGIPITLNVVF
jgi:hypothetical protein